MNDALKRYRGLVEAAPVDEALEIIAGDLCRGDGGKFASCGNAKTFDPSAITKILDVRDTRLYIEDGDRFIPVPGSGNARECDRCGKSHEIHVDVATSDGRTFCVGGSCARGTSVEKEVQSKVRAATAGIAKRKALEAEHAKLSGDLEARIERLARAYVEVEAAPIPPVEVVTISPGLTNWKMGDVRAFRSNASFGGTPEEEMGVADYANLVGEWRANRVKDSVGEGADAIGSTVRRIADLEAKLAPADAPKVSKVKREREVEKRADDAYLRYQRKVAELRALRGEVEWSGAIYRRKA